MTVAFRTSRRVEFRDTDAAGIAHFTSFFAYMEEAEHAFLRSLGTSVVTHDEHGTISWPRVSTRCDFHCAARFEDLLEIEVTVERIGRSSITYTFQFLHDARLVASGSITAVHCRLAPGQPPAACPIPDELVKKLTRADMPCPDTWKN